MQAQQQKIKVPKHLAGEIVIENVAICPQQRVYRDDVLITLRLGQDLYQVRSAFHGWVKRVLCQEQQAVQPNDVLCVLSIFDADLYHPAESEVNLTTELGQHGRRGLEREGQRRFGSHDKALFEAPTQEGQGVSPVKAHPLLANSKPGVPPKMSADAQQNLPAVQQFAEDAQTDPELQAQLSQELEQQLGIQPGPSTAPTPTITK